MIQDKLKDLIEKYCTGTFPSDAQMDEISGMMKSLGLNANEKNEASRYMSELINGPTREQMEAERKAREEAERKAREEAERKKAEAERKAREEAERKKAEAERKAREEAERKKAEAERKAREEAERKKAEAERKAREEAERKKAEAERKAREEAERKKAEAERKKAEAARKKAEAARKKAEAERKAKAEAACKAREEAERKAREEAERKVREETERKAREEAERKAREEAERKVREETERKAREEFEREDRKATILATIFVVFLGIVLALLPLLIANLFSWNKFSVLITATIIWFALWHALRKDDKGYNILFLSAGLTSLILCGILAWKSCKGPSEDELKAKYETVYSVGNDGLRVVSLNGKKGLIDDNCKEVFELKYDEIRDPVETEEENGMKTLSRVFVLGEKRGLVLTGIKNGEDITQSVNVVMEAKYDSIYFDTETKHWTAKNTDY